MSPAQAQEPAGGWPAALADQLAVNGVADAANPTAEELAAAVATLIANNPGLTANDIAALVQTATAVNPAAYSEIALAATEQAVANGITDPADLEFIAAVATAADNGITPDAVALAAAITTATAVTVSAPNIVDRSEVLANTVLVPDSDLTDLIIAENPNQDDASDA